MRRREFLATSAAVLALRGRLGLAEPKRSNAATLPRRPFGKTGIQLSIIGFPGLVLAKIGEDEARRLVAESVERGCNYFDVAPAYGDAEGKLGPALQPHREKVFLACKTKRRDRKGADEEFHRSLKRLRTDRFDLYQLHCLRDVKKDVDAAFARGGAMEFLSEEKKAGRIRTLGFSAHSEEAALAAMERFPFDSILFPVNFGSVYKGRFGPRVLEAAKQRGVVVLAMKGLSRQWWPQGDPGRRKWRLWYQPVSDRAEADLALRFTLGQGAVSAVPPSNPVVHRLAMDLAPGLEPLGEAETKTLRELAATLNPVFSESRVP